MHVALDDDTARLLASLGTAVTPPISFSSSAAAAQWWARRLTVASSMAAWDDSASSPRRGVVSRSTSRPASASARASIHAAMPAWRLARSAFGTVA